MTEQPAQVIDQLVDLDDCDGYVVLVVDPESTEANAHGPYDGLQVTSVADRLRTELDHDDLTDVVVTVVRLHRPRD